MTSLLSRTSAIRSPGPHGDLHPQTGNLHPEWRQRASSAGEATQHWFLTNAASSYDVNSDHWQYKLYASRHRKCLTTWKRKEMQAFSRVCQDWCSLAGRHCEVILGALKTCLLVIFAHFCSFSVLDLNAFERQNKAEGLGMVTEEGSSKWWDLSLHALYDTVHISSPNAADSDTHFCWSSPIYAPDVGHFCNKKNILPFSPFTQLMLNHDNCWTSVSCG